MTRQSLEELVNTWRPRYLRASRKEKTLILDEFVALTHYHRKAAIRLLRKGRKPKRWDRRGRPRVYTNQVKAALIEVWEVRGRTTAGEYLHTLNAVDVTTGWCEPEALPKGAQTI
jgi:hypothetical protein